MWSNKRKHNAAAESEEFIVLDLVQIVGKNVRNENKGALKTHLDYKVVLEILTTDRIKTNQCAIDRGSATNKMLEIEQE